MVVSVGPPRSGKDVVSELLQRMGWVRKNVAEPGQEVRAIALVESFPEELAYSAAAVADSVDFKTYSLAIAFDDVAV